MSVIQFRRGTAAGNPVLAVGEPGYKTSTGEFKVGDGTTAWNSLPVFATTTNITAAVNAAVSGLVNGAPGALDTLKELADALGDDANFAATVTSALAAKAPLASPTFTGTVAGITKTMVGLGNVDNTSDAAKPVSTAQQTALDGKQGFTDGARSSALTSKLLGGNITVKPGYDWRYLWSEWDWDNWIRPQIDRAVHLGLHAVRYIGAPRLMTDTSVSQVAWAASTAYTADRQITKGGNTYRCTTAGTSASSGGPTGTGTSITDGTVTWTYVRPDDLTPLTQSVYDARFAQLVKYCASKGLLVYPCLTQQYDYESLGVNYQAPAITAAIVASAASLSAFPNVIGFDIFQEGDVNKPTTLWATSKTYSINAFTNNGGRAYRATTGGVTASSGSGPTGTGTGITDGTVVWDYVGGALAKADVLALAAALRAVSNVPVTMSVNPQSFSNVWSDTTNLWYQCLADPDGLDFIDMHVYDSSITADNVETFANLVGKPVLIGEYGCNQSQDSASQVARYSTILPIQARVGVVGSFVWALADQGSAGNPSGQAGVWDNTGFVQGSAPLSTTSGVRANLASVVRRLVMAQPAPPNLVNLTSAQTLTNKTFTGPKVNQIKDANGNVILNLLPTASAVNYVEVANSAAGGAVQLSAQGTDSNVDMFLQPKGSGKAIVFTETGQTPTIKGSGADANHNLNLQSKGTGVVQANGVEVLTANSIHAFTGKTTPVDADELALVDSAAANAMKKLTIADLKALVAAAILGGAPSQLDTLKELADAINDDASFAATVTAALALKAPLVSPSFTTPALGTPASGTLTNCTGLPVAGVAASTSAALGVGSLEVGHATDTTISRSAAGKIAVEGVDVPTVSSADTLTNKTLTTPKVAAVNDANGNKVLSLLPTASAVNYIELANAAAGGAVILSAQGSDSNINIFLQPKGTGVLDVYVATGQTPTIKGTGVDANYNLNLQSKGTGVVQANGNPVGVKVAVPASASATGVLGQWAADSSFIYVCTAANTWMRAAIATW